jgi:hypothetical protein
MEIDINVRCVFLSGGGGGGSLEANFGSVVVVFSLVVVRDEIFKFVGKCVIVFRGVGTASAGVSTTSGSPECGSCKFGMRHTYVKMVSGA